MVNERKAIGQKAMVGHPIAQATGIKSWPEDDRPREKLLAGYELREIERERSEGYINRVKDFLDGYDDSKEKIDFADKKQLAELLFKNIKIASCLGGRLP